MNTIKRMSVLLAVMVLVQLSWSQPETNEPPLSLAIDLVDGSRIMGVPSIASVPVQTDYAKLDIALKNIQTITMEKNHKTALFEMRNGDRVKGAVILKTLGLKTTVGKVSIILEQIVKIDMISGNSLKTGLVKGLVLYYSFDKDESVYVADLSGKGNNGMLHGTEWIPQGKVGGARIFNGKNDYISVDYDEKTGLFPVDTPLSVAVWFKTSAVVPSHPTLVTTHYAGTDRDGYWLRVNNTRSYDGKAEWVPVVAGADVRSLSAVNDGQWHHAVGVWDGRQSFLYLGGVLQGTAQAVGPLVYTHRVSFRIGHVENNNAPHARDEYYYFKGAMDDVMVFNRALSGEDVKALFNAYK